MIITLPNRIYYTFIYRPHFTLFHLTQ